MNFVSGLLNPFNCGYIYGTTLAMTTNNRSYLNSPLLTLVDAGATAILYGASSDLVSRFIFTEKAQYLMSGVLLATSAYRVYKFVKNMRSNKIDSYCPASHEREDSSEDSSEDIREDSREDNGQKCADNIDCECMVNNGTLTNGCIDKLVEFSTMEEVD